MEYKTGNSNGWITDTPDKLYGKFISVVDALPDDVTKWSLPLCDRYYSTLMTSLQDKMDKYKFRIPSLDELINTLRLVRTAAVTSYASLLKEKELLRRLIPSNNHHHRGIIALPWIEHGHPWVY